MIAHGNEEIEESVETHQYRPSQCKRDPRKDSQPPTPLHLHLHRPAPLERAPRPYDQRQIMCPELRIAIRRVRIGVPRRCQDCRTLYPALQPLLPQSESFELVQPVFLRRAIHERILQQPHPRSRICDCALHGPPVGPAGAILEFPAIPAFVVQQAGVVVTLVEVFEHAGEDFWGFVGKRDAFGGGFEKLAAADGGEERGGGEDGFVGGKEAGFGADAEGNYWGGEGANFLMD